MSRPEESGAGGDAEPGGFLGRWSRRKREAAQETIPPSDAAAPSPAAELPLPSLDDIVPGADVSAFFRAHVPEALRTAALRKLWVTDPTIKDFIEMADYQWDFTNPDAIPGWSSSIGDFDVGKLVERIMGGVSSQTSPMDTAEIAAEGGPNVRLEASDCADSAVSDSTDNDLDSSTSQSIADLSADHVAVQNNREESEVYLPARKRHGGALPS
jgi:hypothetical protein